MSSFPYTLTKKKAPGHEKPGKSFGVPGVNGNGSKRQVPLVEIDDGVVVETLFCAGGVLVSIPISVLFVIMQKFYVEGITSGADKG